MGSIQPYNATAITPFTASARRTQADPATPAPDPQPSSRLEGDQRYSGGGPELIQATAITLNAPGQFDANDAQFILGDYYTRPRPIEDVPAESEARRQLSVPDLRMRPAVPAPPSFDVGAAIGDVVSAPGKLLVESVTAPIQLGLDIGGQVAKGVLGFFGL